MEKSKKFYNSHFPAEVLERADQKLRGHAQGENFEFKYITLSVEHADDDANWEYESFTEFLADYRRFANKATYTAKAGTYYLSVDADYMYIKVT